MSTDTLLSTSPPFPKWPPRPPERVWSVRKDDKQIDCTLGQEIVVPLRDKLLPALVRIEREMIKAALCDHHGTVDAVAKALGISRKGLYLKRQRLGL